MKENLLIGGYTKSTSKGIYSLTFDTEKEVLSEPKLVVNAQQPTYFAISNEEILYPVQKEGDEGGIGAYDMKDHYKNLGSALQPKNSPAYVEVDEQRQLVFSANFHTAIVTVYKINADKTLTITDKIQLDGHSVRPEQDASHPHFSHVAPDGNLVICDYGADKILSYSISKDDKATKIAEFKAPAGVAPRHLTFNPDHPNIAYCICELGSVVLVLNYQDGKFDLINSYNILPDSFDGTNTAAAIRISNDSKFLYTSNRGFNSIVSFKVSDDGKTLEHLQTINTQGDFPRDFNFDLTGKFIIVPHQKSNNVTIFKRNPNTGYLTFVNNNTQVPEGTCVVFY